MTPISADRTQIWRSVRPPLLIGGLIVAVAVLVVLLRPSPDAGALDPEGVAPAGSRALARIVAAQGVTVVPMTRLADVDGAAEGATVLVTRPALLTPEELARLRNRSARLVVIAPLGERLDAVLPGAAVSSPEEDEYTRSAGCADPAATAADRADLGGVAYSGRLTSCFDGTMIVGDGVVVFGSGTPFTNGHLADHGNAALTMRVLGQHQRLIWYQPSADDPGLAAPEKTLYDLIPGGWRYGALTAVLGVVLLALWRARRLGPVVVEPLPVVVHAAETVRGRALLYRRARAADHAADALRTAARERLATRVGLAAEADLPAVVETVAARCGLAPAHVYELLFGPPPRDERALVALADDLDRLEEEVARR